MKHLTLIFALLMSVSVSAQVFGPPETVPKEYWKAFPRKERKEIKQDIRDAKEIADKYDFYVPETPLPMVQAEPVNWSLDYLEINQNAARIRQMARGRVDCAILDTGFPDNKEVSRYASAKPPISYTGEPVIDGHFHSTHVAGSQSASPVGVANELAKMGLFTQTYYKICTNSGGCQQSWMEAAVQDYKEYYLNELKPNGIAGVINMSVGGGSISSGLQAALKSAQESGIAIFASAGNNGATKISCPGCSPYTFSIGAVGKNGARASFSNQGPEQSFAGPGVMVTSTCLGDTYCNASGTSMSSPQVAAVYAILKSIRPDWSPEQVIAFMAQHAEDAGGLGFDNAYGYGIPKIGKYLDNIGDIPDEPTCDDGIKNGGEEGIDCGGPCPPCEVPGPCERREMRTSNALMEGEWRILWGEIGTASMLEPFDYEVQAGAPVVSSSEWLYVTRLELEFTSDLRAPCSFIELREEVTGFFRNRGLALPQGWDYTDALYWTSYFLDMHLERKGYDVKVARIEGAGQDENPAYWDYPRDWKSQSDQVLWEGQVLWQVERTAVGPGLPSYNYLDYVSTREKAYIDRYSDTPDLGSFEPPMDGWKAVKIFNNN